MGKLIPTLVDWHDNLRFFGSSLTLRKGFEVDYVDDLCKLPCVGNTD